MWSVSGIFLNAQKVIVLKELTNIPQLDTFWISENQILQQETTGPDSRKVSAAIIYLSIWRNSMQRLIKRVLNSLHKTRFWITTLLTDVKQFFKNMDITIIIQQSLNNFCKVRPSSFTLKSNSKDSGQTVLVSAVFYWT